MLEKEAKPPYLKDSYYSKATYSGGRTGVGSGITNRKDSYSTMSTTDNESDMMIKDKKKLELSGYEVIPIFFINLFVVLPIWLVVLLPPALLSQGVSQIMTKLSPKSKKSSKDVESSESSYKESETLPGKAVTKIVKEREFDLVIFGATGFTGQMAAVYVAKRYGDDFKWAIAGRRRSALQNVKDKATAINPKVTNLSIIIADTNDRESLEAMVKQTKVIISTAGPFAKYGSELVELCSVHGTHYCDITGETDWVREMIDKHDDTAKVSGARIVHFCGHDCVPWDLAVLECSKCLKAQGESIMEVNCYDEISSSPSGGTMATVFHALSNRYVIVFVLFQSFLVLSFSPSISSSLSLSPSLSLLRFLYEFSVKGKSSLGFDPLLKDLDGKKTKNDFITENTFMLGYSAEYKSWIGPFVMSAVMANCIKRSNALNNYSSKLTYRESQVYPSFMAGQ
jgi:short subunit dehydrogenase-like uncharacterized protein